VRTKQIPIIVGGGLDTKTNPKLLKPGSALQIDNMFQQRPGEWRARNGMTTQVASNKTITSAPFPYATPSGGGVSAVARGLGSFAPAVPVRFGTRGTGSLGWESANGTNANTQFPYPTGVASTVGLYGDGASDVFDGDLASAGGFIGTIALAGGAKFFEAATGRLDDYSAFLPSFVTPPRMTATTSYLVAVGLTGAGPYSIQLIVYGVDGSIATYTPASLASVVATAQPWFDVIANPGTNTITVAYRASVGGVSAAVVDLSTGAVTVGPTRYAAADATMALAFVNATAALGSSILALATAGGTNGVAYFTITIATLVAGGTVTVDATATANVRQLAGHFDDPSTVTILWEVPGSSRIYDTVKRGRFASGAWTTIALAPSYSLYSRTAKNSADGKWYFIGAYDSPTAQSCYALLTCDDYAGVSNNRAAPACFVMPGEGGGRRAAQSSVTNLIASGSTFLCTLPRKRRVTVAGVAATQGRVLQLVTFSDALPTASRARELGGVTYLPGGLVYVDDGQSCRPAVFPRYPEVPALVSFTGGGGMTSGKTYGYRLVLKRKDSAGRIIRSAGSVPVTITLGASDNLVQLTIPNPYLYWCDFLAYIEIEIYRVGPIESGATLYNLVGTTVFNQNTDTLTIVNDFMSDATAALGEVAYFTGNVEENIAPPSCSLLEVNGGRLWIVNAEDPSELRYSKQSKAGAIPGFTPDFALRIDGDGRGGITALGSMDGRLVVFKDGAIWVVSGDGPNDLGQGSFSPPQIISRETGVPAGLARSVVSTPDGLMFQSPRGIYLLGRGLGLEYIGAPVELYTLAANVVDASTVRGTTQVRFLMASGRCLVWDYQAKAWSTFILPVGASSAVGCVDANAGWYYVTADGKLRLEVAGAASDDGAAIVPVISLPHLSFAGLSGYQRLYSLDLLFDVLGNHTFSVDAEFNYSGALTGSPKTKAVTTATPTAQVQYPPPDGLAKCTAMRPVITVSGSPVSGTFRLTSVTAQVGIKSGTNIPDTNRLT
jgi:hypothetical protein